ncbi:hypothetical protein ABFX02_09G009300 [Erythranthe guttata]
MVGKSLVYVDRNTALEIIRRVNVKHDSVLSAGSVNDMFGMWETVLKQKASKINNITWKVSVNVGFGYLVRLHFSEIGLKMAKIGGVIFAVHINEMIAATSADMVRERDDENDIPWYRDYIVVTKGHKEDGKRDVVICLQSSDEFIDGHGPLKGFEIMKLSNHDNSLASPNPVPSSHESSYRTRQNLHKVLDHRNMIATLAITLLVAVNIILYISRQIWESGGVEEKENMPSARAVRLCRRFSLAEIQLATGNFSDAHLIGRGGFGNVYKGLIDNGGETVAIKRQKLESRQGAHEFLTEIETLTELRHVNLVTLVGYCNEHGEMILVYEYMACGTLADHLFKHVKNNNDCPSLNWKQRLAVCIGAGRGLDYLHTGHSLIHRDVKASNILLDDNFIAKVSDFGLAKHLSRTKLQSYVSTKVKGTFGYLDPNYFTTGKLTRKSDTYAFGVVLLEVLSGRPAVDFRIAENERILTKWARENISNGNADQIIASNLRGEISEDSLKVFVGIAERCLHDEPKKRPTMAQVVLQLEFALDQQESPTSPVPNGIISVVDDSHTSDEKNNLLDSTVKPTMSSRNVQNLIFTLKEQTSMELVHPKPASGRKAVRKDRTNKPSRIWPWNGFMNRFKPSGNSTGCHTTEEAEKGKRTVNMLPVVVPPIPVLKDKRTVNLLPVVVPPIPVLKDKRTVNLLPVVVPPIPVLKDKQIVDMLPIAVDAISVDELYNITYSFGSNSLIGEGSYGRVYLGVMKRGQPAAIKMLNFGYQPYQDFLAQVSMISTIKHENVVELLGYCVDGGLRVLAYEFAPHGSLHDILHGKKGFKASEPGLALSWAQRVKIAVGGAKGLEYIHEKGQIHCDIKSSNFLLFDDYDFAKIADFYLRSRTTFSDTLDSTGLIGTVGYHAPEYGIFCLS